MKTAKKWNKLFLVGMLAMVLAFSFTGCATLTRPNGEGTAVVRFFSQKVPDAMQGSVIASYKKTLGIFAKAQEKADYEASLKGLQEGKDYYVVVGAGMFTTIVTAVRR